MSTRFDEARAALDGNRRAQAEAAAARGPSLFGSDADAAIESVADHAGPVWRDAALNALRRLAEQQGELTVEDLAPLCPATTDARALGAILREGARRRWIVKQAFVPGDRSRHGRAIVLWRSLLNAGASP